MKKPGLCTLTIITLLAVFSEIATAQVITNYGQSLKEWENDNRAIIVVTGLKLSTDKNNVELADPSEGEGAIVKLTPGSGSAREKKTEAFPLPFAGGGTFYTSDFPVIMDSVYSISITFRNGTIIRIDDYCLHSRWKTHHYFHSTDGRKNPASLLRKEMDEKTGFWCYIYSLYPFSNYKASGGIQVK